MAVCGTDGMQPLLVLLPGLDGTKVFFEPLLRGWDAVVVDYAALFPVVLAILVGAES